MKNIYHFGGMHFLLVFILIGLLCWIFFTPWGIPGERKRRRDAPLDILKKCFASGKISKDQYFDQKETLETVYLKKPATMLRSRFLKIKVVNKTVTQKDIIQDSKSVINLVNKKFNGDIMPEKLA